jgi:photosystem II stability/assembly factor-like uncharacterized protein
MRAVNFSRVVVAAALAGAGGGSCNQVQDRGVTVKTGAVQPAQGDFTGAPVAGGLALAIGAGPNTPWVVGMDSAPWHLQGPNGSRTWAQLATGTTTPTSRIAVSPIGTPWRVDTSGNVQRFIKPPGGTAQWTSLAGPPGGCVSDIGVGMSSGQSEIAWAIGCDTQAGGHSIYSWTAGSGWRADVFGGSGELIAVSPEGTPSVINNQLQIWRRTSTGWIQPDQNARALALGAGPNNTIWVVGLDNFAWESTGDLFFQVSTTYTLSQISVAADGTPWAITTSNQVARWGGFWSWLGPSGTSGATRYTGEVTDVDALWASSSSSRRLVAATAGGGVWVTDPNTTPALWTPISDAGFGAGPAQAVASVAQRPNDANTMLIATGIPACFAGTGCSNDNGFSGNRGHDPPAQLGNGIWRGTIGSATAFKWQWTQVSCGGTGPSLGCPTSFWKIRFHNNGQGAWAASPSGFFYSTDAGVTFHQAKLFDTRNAVTDLASDPANAQRVYAAVSTAGVEISNDGGKTFSAPSFPKGVTNSSWIAYPTIALAPSNDHVMYLMVNSASPWGDFNGIFYSTNVNTTTNSPTWTESLPGCSEVDCSGAQKTAYNGLPPGPIAVSPASSDAVLAAARGMARTQNGTKTAATANCPGGNCCSNPLLCVSQCNSCCNNASSCTPVQSCSTCSATNGWTSFNGVNATDYHAIAFDPGNSSNVYIGADGGIFRSTDGGVTWNDSLDSIGVTNASGVSVLGDNILGTSWDVPAYGSTDHGNSWRQVPSVSDGVSALITSDNQWLTDTGAQIAYSPSTDTGRTMWNVILTNVVPGPNPMDSLFGEIYTVGATAGSTTSSVWRVSSGVPQPFSPPANFANPPTTLTAVLYADHNWVIAGGFSAGTSHLLMAEEQVGAGWVEIGANIPLGKTVVTLGGSTASAPMSGIARVRRDKPSGDPIIYVLTTAGALFADDIADITSKAQSGQQPAWVTLTGNLPPNLTYLDLVADPAHGTVFVATNVGVFKTNNSCMSTLLGTVLLSSRPACWPTTWQLWGDQLPLSPSSVTAAGQSGAVGTAVNRLDAQTRADGHFYVYAATWERGIWVRDALGDDE